MNSDRTTLADAAARLGTTTLNTLLHIKSGTLVATEIEGTWLIDNRSLEDLLATIHTRINPACAPKTSCGGCSCGAR